MRRGADHWNSVLTEDQVLAIYRDDRPSKVVAAEYGINYPAVNKIRSGQRWGWLTKSDNDPCQKHGEGGDAQ